MSATRSSNGWAYRPHLDGLRAVAVYLVVAFHAGVARFSGGFIGVDVFFVLSGYLVTGVLLRDLEGPDGRIGLARFYARRARRLLPAAAVTLVVTAIVFESVGGRVEVLDARGAIRAASLYVANWHFIAKSADYFAADLESSPVLHFWSLAVEEQFYLLWPLVFGALYGLARRSGPHRSRVLRGAIAVLALASGGAALRLAESDLERTTAPTPGPTSVWRARSSRCRPASSSGPADSASAGRAPVRCGPRSRSACSPSWRCSAHTASMWSRSAAVSWSRR